MVSSVRIVPLTVADVTTVARFLHAQLNPRLSVHEWARSIVPPWPDPGPHHGLGLWDGDLLVGVYLAFWSKRRIAGEELLFCNLAAWAVLDDYRVDSLRLVRALLRSGADVYTDLSPSGSVVAITERLGFQRLDTTTSLRLNLPSPPRRGFEVVTDASHIAAELQGMDAEVFNDHRDAVAAQHILLRVHGRPCYVIYRNVRRKRLPLFAAIVHVSDPEVFAAGVDALGAHLFAGGTPLLLAEHRIVGGRLSRARIMAGRPKFARSAVLDVAHVDDLYSEITCVPW